MAAQFSLCVGSSPIARRIGLMLSAALLLALPSRAQQVQVAVAANFAAPAKALAAQFEQASGHKLALSFGATGQFYAQIRNGAPFAVLLAADEETPEKLQAQGLAVAGTRQTYATGRLVLWSKQAGLVDGQGHVLRAPLPGRLALADPRLSPYGRASAEVIAALGLTLRGQAVEAAHIGQTYQFIASGNAALGFVALSQVYENGRLREGSGWIVPESLHKPIRQQAVLLRAGSGQPAAAQFLSYLRSAQAQALVASYGYSP